MSEFEYVYHKNGSGGEGLHFPSYFGLPDDHMVEV